MSRNSIEYDNGQGGQYQAMRERSTMTTLPRLFALRRDVDETGVSGVGTVAYGVEFGDGRCVMRWSTHLKSTALYDSIQELEHIHGHDGSTTVVWLETEAEADA